MTDLYPPKPAIASRSHLGSKADYERLYEQSISDPTTFWDKEAARLAFFHPYHTVHAGIFAKADFQWFVGGKLNVSFNCLDRHLEKKRDQDALIWACDEPGQYRHISYGELFESVCKLANALLAFGVKRGDRVCIYMPMIPETVYAMLACARIGAIHSVVFGGFSADSLRDRILDAGCKLIITANEGLRGGKIVHLKRTVDHAISGLPIEAVLVAKRTEHATEMQAGRDHWLHEVMERERPYCPPEWMDAESPLFILYTSGSTGKPKGVLHTTAGYLLFAAWTHEKVFDWREDDVYCCAADVGWITGHSYIVYGPLCNGATTVLFESIPVFPDAGRYWQLVDDLKISIFYTAPTALRAIAKAGDDFVKRHSRASLRVLGTVGEPINPEIWKWYHDVVGDKRCAVVDTWWQTETGGILISPLPGATTCKPGSATFPLPGVRPVLVDDSGKELVGNGVTGNLCLAASWPGQARTVWGDHGRFHRTYFSMFPGRYFTGDGCRRDEDGYYWITGRVDDVLNVSGHRLGTAEIESALVGHETVAEAAVVGYPHDMKGTGIFAYVMPAAAYANTNASELVGALKEQVRKVIGPIATPDKIMVVPGLPKTRSGKIMRRILRKIACAEYSELGDLTTLADPGVVDKIVASHKTMRG